MLARACDQRLQLCLVADIAGNTQRLAARLDDPRSDFLARALLAAGDHDIGASRRHLLPDRAADAARGARNDRGLAGEIEEVHERLPRVASGSCDPIAGGAASSSPSRANHLTAYSEGATWTAIRGDLADRLATTLNLR